jgi:mannose-1-phosphate guanylyltransferase/mannose-6-phosphate isomerase
MFLMSARAFLDELRQLRPEVLAACESAVERGVRDLDFLRVDASAMEPCPSVSIDHAVFEHTRRAAVRPVDFAWSDLGSWKALWDIGDHDASGNVVHGEAVLEDVHDSYVHAQGRLVAAVGLSDIVVVETPDAVLVARRERAQDVRLIVARLLATRRPEGVIHRRVYRPWGTYETVDAGERFQVKRITVNPGASLSLQMHHHRAEHWIVVRGTARVTRGDEVMTLAENQSTYIPLGVRHRLENPGRIPLELIEVQSGAYLGEDDIVRFEDHYNRN